MRWYFSIILFCLFSCESVSRQEEESNQTRKLSCYFFFIADCPASQDNIPKIQQLYQDYSSENFRVIGVVSDPKIDSIKLKNTLSNFNVSFEIVVDSSLVKAKNMNVTTTPEVVLLLNDSVVYSGKLDDYYFELGKHKLKAHKSFLRDAIEDLLAGREVEQKRVEPIGCLINFDLMDS